MGRGCRTRGGLENRPGRSLVGFDLDAQHWRNGRGEGRHQVLNEVSQACSVGS